MCIEVRARKRPFGLGDISPKPLVMTEKQVWALSARLACALVDEAKAFAGIYTSEADAFSGAMAVDLPGGKLIGAMGRKLVRVYYAGKLVFQRAHGLTATQLGVEPIERYNEAVFLKRLLRSM